MKSFCAVLLLLSLVYGKDIIIEETFSNGLGTWKSSTSSEFSGRWHVGKGPLSTFEDSGLILQDAAKKHAISTALPSLFSGQANDVVVQYEVRFHKTLECGGAYIKVLAAGDKPFDPETFSNESPYAIMFGPDKCGSTNKVHFIFRHQNPKSLKWEEKHLKTPPGIKNDLNTHLYTLVVRTDNTFEIFIDKVSARKGSLLVDFDPPVNPPEEIDDPTDSKPEDWVDAAKIPDPVAVKPDDWDEDAPAKIVDEKAVMPKGWLEDAPEQVPDPEAEKPDDWDDESDGVWEPPLVENPACVSVGCGKWTQPLIANPKYKGKWHAPMIDNPAYKGPWKARQIPNPHYFQDANPHNFVPMSGVGFELWTMQDNIEFDSVFIGTSEAAAFAFADRTWGPQHEHEMAEEAKKKPGLVSEFMSWFEKNWIVGTAAVVASVIFVIAVLFCCCCNRPQEIETVRPRGAQPASSSASASLPSTESKSAVAEQQEDDGVPVVAEPRMAAVPEEPDQGSTAESTAEECENSEATKDEAKPRKRRTSKPPTTTERRRTPDRAAKSKNRSRKAE